MNDKQTIAEKHGVDLNNFQIRNIIVKDITIFNCCCGIFLLIISLVFSIGAIINQNNLFLLIFYIVLGVVLLLLSIVFLGCIFLFKIGYQDGRIYYRCFCGKCNFHVTDIQYFIVEEDPLGRFYTIRIYFNNKKIKYTISQNHKQNFIFLLNLLKSGIEQM